MHLVPSIRWFLKINTFFITFCLVPIEFPKIFFYWGSTPPKKTNSNLVSHMPKFPTIPKCVSIGFTKFPTTPSI